MVWLGSQRGHAADWSTQLWVRATGREVALDEHPWLAGPIGETREIGGECFRRWAVRENLRVEDGSGTRGLLADFALLDGPRFRAASVAEGVRNFYERTTEYELDAWSNWCGAFQPFGWLLAVMFSRRLRQLNVPLTGLDTSRGISNEVWHLVEPHAGELRLVAWVRHLLGTGTTVYAGSYGACSIPGWSGPCLKVVFPLPNGNAIVFLKPVLEEDGSLSLISSGERFGDPGFYFTVKRAGGRLAVRYLRSFRETIRVYASGTEEVRADHEMRFWGATVLRIHYRMRRRLR